MNIKEWTEKEFAEIIAGQGGRLYRVGGCVRDIFMGIEPKDIDFCVTGMVKKNFKQLFPTAEECGKSFPVFRLMIEGQSCEVAFARTERKTGSGYHGFTIASNPKIRIEEDLFRRDTTVNSMAIDSLTGKVIDPFGGREDIQRRLLRATSRHFSDDPVRAIRLAGQAARLGFTVEDGTLLLAGAAAEELANEPVERIIGELTKVLNQASQVSRFFIVLKEAGLLSVTFPALAALSGDRFVEAMQELDAVAAVTDSAVLRFAILGFNLEEEALLAWNARMTLPGDWLNAAVTAGKIRRLLTPFTPETAAQALQFLRRGPLGTAEFDLLGKAANLELPPLQDLKIALADITVPGHLRGREIGEWLRLRQEERISELIREKM